MITAQHLPATVDDLGAQTGQRLQYTFAADSGMTDELMHGTSGSPVLNSAGEVAGLLTIGGLDSVTGKVWSAATPVSAIRQALLANA